MVFITKCSAFSSTKRFCDEFILHLIAYTSASLFIFLATTINYSPNLIALTGLLSTFLYLTAFYLSPWQKGKRTTLELLPKLLRRFIRTSGGLTILYFISPVALAFAFTSDRDIANKITQIRIFLNQTSETDFGFINKFSDLKLNQPMLVKMAPNDNAFIYVLERKGKVIKIPYPSGEQPKVALDFSQNMGEVEMENGALGMAFSPNFNNPEKNEQFIYIYYTDTRSPDIQNNMLVRFDIGHKTHRERLASEQVILSMQRHNDGFHNGGSIEFGPDGFLYVGLGEGVHPKEALTSDKVLRGGILRLDVNNSTQSTEPSLAFNYGLAQNYLIPKGNPFVGHSKILDEYWALGLRNPFRFSFDKTTQNLWLGDVGSTLWEEINLIKKGFHYQFPTMEGRSRTSKQGWENLQLPQIEPVFTYRHDAYDRAVIGGMVYSGVQHPSLTSKYLFADNYSGKLYAMATDQPTVDTVDIIARANQYAQRGISSVSQLDSGEVLITTLGSASHAGGEILELVKAKDADIHPKTQKNLREYSEYIEARSASLFSSNCARCHGLTGDGKGPDSSSLGVALPDLTSPVYHTNNTALEIQAIISHGGVGVGKSPMMPEWKNLLETQEIEHLSIYIQSLPKKHHRH